METDVIVVLAALTGCITSFALLCWLE